MPVKLLNEHYFNKKKNFLFEIQEIVFNAMQDYVRAYEHIDYLYIDEESKILWILDEFIRILVF